MDSSIKENASKFLNFLNNNPTPYHVVESARQMLSQAGFQELRIAEQWSVRNGGKYFLTKNESTLMAFVVGGKYQSGNGFAVVGAHTDSPALKVKLVSKKSKVGYLQVGVECYGGGIWHTWFDRDLTVAGRVLLKQNDKVVQKLVHIKRPILRIPNLAIHLNRETNEKFSPNKENHLVPILATVVQEQLLRDKKDAKVNPNEESMGQVGKHHSLLIDLIKNELNCSEEEIVDLELVLADTQPAVLGGALEEFIFGGRLDNQVGAYCTIKGLMDSVDMSDIENESIVRMACIYDHEEIGSESAQGAASSFTEHVMRRLNDSQSFELAVARSFMISADQAHAIHPNYSELHEENHRPSINGGIVLKYNGNQRYATNSVSASILRESARMANVKVQDFMVKNDCPCGSTIGPILAAKLGLTTVDIGAPQLSMHSIRECGSTASITQMTNVLSSFFSNFTKIRKVFSNVL
ncbi:aspartyl aminopeptidase isoform X2 [Brachionus plicatilis]|uniref:Aspartyl aminopeptidase n=1 Tax=Brachionus plicatilis TaxID=10195 RepID=A0A3M7QL90_BRAPC|nr:aspartyl aminopeptidase isoform X2 [Brachionus plicatilis]